MAIQADKAGQGSSSKSAGVLGRAALQNRGDCQAGFDLPGSTRFKINNASKPDGVVVDKEKAEARGLRMGRREGRRDFFTSELFNKLDPSLLTELLSRYHDSKPFMEKMSLAAKHYFNLAIARYEEQARAKGFDFVVDQDSINKNLLELEGWNGDPDAPMEPRSNRLKKSVIHNH